MELVESCQVLKAVESLIAYEQKSSPKTPNNQHNNAKDEKPTEDNGIYLCIHSKQVHIKKAPKPKQFEIPYPLFLDTARVCLFVKDNPQNQTISDLRPHFGKIIPYSKLSSSYRDFEAKRQLLKQYDIFATDARLERAVNNSLGSTFQRKKRHPIPVDIEHSSSDDVLAKIEKMKKSATCIACNGVSNTFKIARLDFTPEQVVSNIMVAIKYISESNLVQGWDNVQSLHVKSSRSPALPFYHSLPYNPSESPSPAISTATSPLSAATTSPLSTLDSPFSSLSSPFSSAASPYSNSPSITQTYPSEQQYDHNENQTELMNQHIHRHFSHKQHSSDESDTPKRKRKSFNGAKKKRSVNKKRIT